MSLADIATAARAHHLAVFGALHPEPDDKTQAGTVILLGPHEPGYWAHIQASPEWQDTRPDPIDRWSTRVITDLAQTFEGSAHFPFGGPPFEPFFTWAIATGEAWASPVHLLVHAKAGLMLSYRGAIALPKRLELPPRPNKPCDTCAKPCLTACPSGALSSKGYDVPACHAFLDTAEGQKTQMTLGCNVRRACPRSQSYARMPAHSAYHMSIFHK